MLCVMILNGTLGEPRAIFASTKLVLSAATIFRDTNLLSIPDEDIAKQKKDGLQWVSMRPEICLCFRTNLKT